MLSRESVTDRQKLGRLYLGIDPATKCGWAVLNEEGKRLYSGVWDLKRGPHEGGGMVFVRFEKLFREMLGQGQPWEWDRPIVVAFEKQANRFAGSAHIGLGIIAHIERICEDLGVPYTGVAFSTVKKVATGKGNASKEQVVQAAIERWELPDTLTDDEADACWIAETVRLGNA